MWGSRRGLSTFPFYCVSPSPEPPDPPQHSQKGEGFLGEKGFRKKGKSFLFHFFFCVQTGRDSASPAISMIERIPAFSMLLGVLIDRKSPFSIIFQFK